MDPAIFSVTFSILMFGFVVGLSLDNMCSKYYFDTMKESLQNGIDRLLEKDEEIDRLTLENTNLRKHLIEMQRNINNILGTNLPPPNTPVSRCSQCFEDDEIFDLDLPETPPHIKNE
jgi:hypothetical protein